MMGSCQYILNIVVYKMAFAEQLNAVADERGNRIFTHGLSPSMRFYICQLVLTPICHKQKLLQGSLTTGSQERREAQRKLPLGMFFSVLIN